MTDSKAGTRSGARRASHQAGLAALALAALTALTALALPRPAAAQAPSTQAASTPPTPTLDLGRFRGQVVLLDFWASWCVPCRQSFPWMERMRESYGGRGLVVVAVNVDRDPVKAERFRASVRGDFVHVADPDGTIARVYGLTVMPTSLVLDREGRPVYRHEGFHAEKVREYEAHLVELLQGGGPKDALPIGVAKAPRLGVRPWERDVLADPAMRLVPDPLELELDDHIYFSKEASSGGRGFGGGGCGCN